MDAKPKPTNQENIRLPPPWAFSMRSYYSELDQLHVVLFKKKPLKIMKVQPVIDANTLRKMDFMIFLFSLRHYFEIETFYTCTMVTLNIDQNLAITLLLF